MGKRSPSPPPAPDPRATAQAQSEFNIDTARVNARLNRVNQNTTQGSVRFDDMGDDRWQSTTTLSPEQQRLYDLSTQAQTTYGEAANSQLGQAQAALSSPFAFNAPAMQSDVQDRTGGLSFRPDFTGVGDPNQSRDAVQEALLARINPDIERERAALENRLANQGITMGSEAWNAGMQDQSRMANDARFGAILNAGQEQSRMFGLGMQQSGFNNAAQQQAFGMDMGRAQFGNQARQQSLQEQLALRGQPVNEASALLTGGQVQMPQFSNVAQVQAAAPDYQGAVAQNYAGAMQQYNAQLQQNAQSSGMLGQLAGTVGGLFGGGMLSGVGGLFGRGGAAFPTSKMSFGNILPR